MNLTRHDIDVKILAKAWPHINLPALPKISSLNHAFEQATASTSKTISKTLRRGVKRYARYVHQLDKEQPQTELPPCIAEYQETFGTHAFNGAEFHAENPKELVVLITGCKSETKHWAKQINHWLSKGRSVIVFNTTVPKKELGFVEDNYKMVQWLLRNENSPIHKLAKEQNLPIKIVAHSFGGYLVVRSLFERESADNLENKIAKTIPLNPFLTAKNLNPDDLAGKITRDWYMDGHAAKNPDTFNGAHPLDIAFAHFHHARGEPHVSVANTPPTHAQVVEMQHSADELREKIKQDGFPESAKRMDVHFHLGEKDYMSHCLAGFEIAKKMSAKCTIVKNSWHNTLHESYQNLLNFDAVLSPRAAAKALIKKLKCAL